MYAVVTLTLLILWVSNSLIHISAQPLENAELTIEYLYISSEINYRYARTKLETQIENTSKYSTLTNFTILIPRDGFPNDFTMEVDGFFYKGYIEIEEIAQSYACNSMESQEAFGYVKVVNYNPSRYVEKIEGPSNRFSHKIKIIPKHAKSVKAFTISINITEFNLLSSGFECIPGKCYGESSLDSLPLVNPNPYSLNHFHKYQHNITEIEELATKGILGKVGVQYVLNSEERNILVRDGYLVHKSKNTISSETVPLHVIFVLDMSSSMLGKRIEYLKAGIKRILNLMLESSKFSSSIGNNNYIDIITFSSNATVWEPLGNNSDPLQLDKNLMKHAFSYIDHLVPAGSSNMYEALLAAIKIANRSIHSQISYPPSIILLITDGEPTSGIIHPSEIISQLEQDFNGTDTIPIHSLTFGSEADYDLCKDLSIYVGKNSGLARKIYEKLDASNYIFEFYKEISSPSLQNVTFVYTNSFERVKKIVKHETIRVHGRPKKQNLALVIDSTTMDFRYLNNNALPCGEECFVEKKEILSSINQFHPQPNLTNFCIKSFNNPRSSIQRKFTQIIDLGLKYDLVTTCTSLIANKESQFRRKLKELPPLTFKRSCVL